MTQGRHLSVVGKAELIVVQVKAADPEVREHDEWESRALRANLQALVSYGPAIEAYGDELLAARWRRHLRHAQELQRRDEPENQRNAEIRELVDIDPDDAA